MKKKQDGVWIAEPGIVRWSKADMDFLQDQAPLTEKRRARLCAHQEGDSLQEMLIAFCAGSKLPRHSHEKAESLLVLTGRLRVSFDDCAYHLGQFDFLRIPAGVMHQPYPLTDCVILETAEK